MHTAIRTRLLLCFLYNKCLRGFVCSADVQGDENFIYQGGRKMELLLQFVLLVVGFVMLVKGADWFVDGAAGIADKFPEFFRQFATYRLFPYPDIF